MTQDYPDEERVIQDSRAGDAVRVAAFDQYRGLLFSIAYRMLGSIADAEDMVQETYLRWQQASGDHIASPRAFLVTIISRLSINHLQSARVRREEYVGQWLPEPLVTDPLSDPSALLRLDESLSMAFLVLLERLTPIERAVFLLREVFEYDYGEIAAVLGQTEVNCRQILRRARQHVSALRPRFTASHGKQNELLERFLQATETGDLERLVAMLSADVVLYSDGGGKAPAVPNPVHGAERVARGVIGGTQKFTPQGLVRQIVQVNGEPGIVGYLNGKPFSVVTIHSSAGRIRAIYVVTNPDKLSHVPQLPSSI